MNPLLQPFDTPFGTVPFSKIKIDDYLPALQKAIALGKQDVEAIIQNPDKPDFANTIEALERSGEKVEVVSTVFFNLNAAETNPQMQALAKELSPLLSEYSNDIILNERLFDRIRQVYEELTLNRETLTAEQQTLLDKTYKSFIRNGANLSEQDKNRLREIDKELAGASLEFGEHVLNETNAYSLTITDEKDLKGLPESAIEAAALTAKEKGQEGSWMFTLQFPSYIPFMTYAENRELREQMYKAYGSRGFKGDANDNQEIILKIVKLRDERARLLGFASHADFVLQERMAENPDKVFDFLDNIYRYARPVAENEVHTLQEYAKSHNGPGQLEKWDVSLYAEKLKKEKFAVDDEILKPYFKLENVLQGVFEVSERLYGLKYKQNTDIEVYHPDVTVYEVEDADGRHIGVFYADFFPRAGKRNGAWMTSFRGQQKRNGQDERPHVVIVCNFTKPTPTKPSLLTFNEVRTLFHEFGHALHGLLAEGTYGSLSGTNVFWDFVELPSQVLENWSTEKESLDLFARHYQTDEPIPADLVQRIKDSSNYMAGFNTLRQIGLARLDMAWHTAEPEQITDVGTFERDVLNQTELLNPVPGTSTSASFSHIFQGGYSSGYYSYKWAEVLDADTFEFFQEKGIFNQETATLFRQHILSAGGSEHPMELYKRFRGKEPSPEALLRRTGLLDQTAVTSR